MVLVMLVVFFFGPGWCIGEAANPGPVATSLDDPHADPFDDLDSCPQLDISAWPEGGGVVDENVKLELEFSALEAACMETAAAPSNRADQRGGVVASASDHVCPAQPVALKLDEHLSFGKATTPLRTEQCILAATALWCNALLQRRWMHRIEVQQGIAHAEGSVASMRNKYAERIEQAACSLVRTILVDLGRQPCSREKDLDDEEDAGVEDADAETNADNIDSVAGLMRLQAAVRDIDKVVRRAFEHCRQPTQDDVANISTALKSVVDAVVIGRHENMVHVECTHRLVAFTTDRDGYTCGSCRAPFSRGTSMWSCRLCDHDLCQRCRDKPDTRCSSGRSNAQPEPVVTPRVSPPARGLDSRRETGPCERPVPQQRGRNRRRGSGLSKSAGFMDSFYGNVTSLSPKAEDFLLSSGCSLWLAGESHIRREDISRRCRAWLNQWSLTVCPAAPSLESERGSYGGVIAAARKHLFTEHICGDTSEDGWAISAEHDLAGRTVHLRGVDVMVLGGYARNGDYHQMAAAIARMTRHGKVPFVLLADFNASPDEVREEGWLNELDAEVILPQASITCHQGAGSLIDFGVASKCLAPYILSFLVDTSVPWGPHDGLRLRLGRDPRAVMVRALTRPRPLKFAWQVPHRSPSKELSWQDAKQEAIQRVGTAMQPDSDVWRLQQAAARELGIEAEATELAMDLATWARATEFQALARLGVHGEAAEPYLGRAAATKFKLRPLLSRPRLVAESLRIPGGYGVAARLWATCRALSSKLLSAMRRDALVPEICLMRSRIVALTLRDDAGLRSAWEAIGEKADMIAGMFAILAACSPTATVSSLEAAIGAFERLERKEMRLAQERANEAWHAWVAQSISKGAKQAHRWANRPNAVAAHVAAPGLCQPTDIVQHHTQIWEKLWAADRSDKVREAFELVKGLRSRALQHARHGTALQHLTPNLVRKVAGQFRKNTSIGVDATAFDDVTEASDESVEELCQIMRKTVEQLALPMQALLVIISLIGKKLGGTRGVAVCASFYRLLMALLKSDVRDWDASVGLEGDSALPGHSPLDEAVWRQLLMEQATLRGKFVVQLLWDVSKFFDSLDVPLLVERVVELQFPLDQLVLAMQAHRAPRVLRALGSFGEPIPSTGTSILAGCTSSTSLSRGYLRKVTAHVGNGGQAFGEHRAEASHYVNQHVDDVSQLIVADTEPAALQVSCRQGLKLANALVRSKLEISDKSIAVASNPRLARLVSVALTRAGQPIASAAQAEDLGISTACGSRRTVGALAKRLRKGLARAQRCKLLTRADPRACKLYQTGVRPQQSYGHAAHGASPSQVRQMRRAAVLSVASAGVQPCTTALLAWRLGPKRDPVIQTPLEQIQCWMKLWARATRAQRKELRLAWARSLPRVLLGGVHWRNVVGPLQATQAVLAQVGWRPVAPDNWVSANGDEYAELEWSTFANAGIIEALELEFERAAWSTASAHFLGRGLETGIPSLEPARSARRWLRRRGSWKEMKALDVVVCGGARMPCRSSREEHCPRGCGEMLTPYHWYWSCPKLAAHSEEVVHKTQWMRRLFDAQYAHLHCLWGRAIVPAELLSRCSRAQADDIEPLRTPGFDAAAADAQLYSDGSGGPRWVPTSTRCAGSAVATVELRTVGPDIVVSNVGILVAQAPGRPTVPRAELWAAILAARTQPPGGTLRLRSDAAYVVRGLQQASAVERLQAGTNGDLWCLLASIIAEKSLAVDVAKVKSHAERRVLLGEVELESFIGNLLADAGAGASAEHNVSLPSAAATSDWEARAFLIAKRLAYLEAERWDTQPALVPAPQPQQRIEVPSHVVVLSSLQLSIRRMGHRLHCRGNFAVCSNCRRRRRLGAFKHWTTTQCAGRGISAAQSSDAGASSPAAAPAVLPREHANVAMVTPAKRRRLVREQAAEHRQDREALRTRMNESWSAQTRALVSSPELGVDEEATDMRRLVSIDPTHDCVACGGFLGCVKCGSVVSTSQRSALGRRCRGCCPAGARGPINRLLAGRPPRGNSWPSGETSPRPQRMHPFGVHT